MKLQKLGSNTTVLKFNGHEVLFSYETPVAAYVYDLGRYVRTNEHYSKTTTKHINKWLENVKAWPVSQEFLNDLVA